MQEQKITSELAFNINGDSFEVPPNAAGWRVRKMKHKGAPEVAYGRNGQPLVLPLEADVDDLRAEVTSNGRYRVDPVDENNKPIEGATSGYVYVHDLAPASTVPSGASPETVSPLAAASDNVVIEAMRMNAEIARAVVNRFPQMVEASAILLRAADGAGLPSRAPAAGDDEGDYDYDDEVVAAAPTSGLDALFGMLAQLAPFAMAAMSGGKIKMPNVAEMLDWRKAARPAKPRAIEAAASTEADSKASAPEPEVELNITPQQMAHFIAIQAALTPKEATLAREVAKGFSKAELHAWLDEMSKLSVAEAVDKIRSILGFSGAEVVP